MKKVTLLAKRDYKKKFKLEDFIIDKSRKESILGVGSFATVYLALCKKDMQKYAIKAVI